MCSKATCKTAETYMRSAAEQPGADSRVRQNLALVVGLQGRFEEAEQIAGQELSPEQAQANVAYLRGMLAQQNAWSQLKDEDKPKASDELSCFAPQRAITQKGRVASTGLFVARTRGERRRLFLHASSRRSPKMPPAG